MESLRFEKIKNLLECYNIPLCPTKLAVSKKEAAVFAKSTGYPVVLKVAAKKAIHKTDSGLMKIGITGEADLKKAWDEITKKARGIKLEGFLVQKQLSGVETIVGMKRDPQFGPVLMFGLGGIMVEIIKDISFRISPVGKRDAVAMIQEIKGYTALKGFRSMKPVDLEKLAEMIVALSKLSLDNENITEIDFNPVIANEKGVWVVDPRFITSSK